MIYRQSRTALKTCIFESLFIPVFRVFPFDRYKPRSTIFLLPKVPFLFLHTKYVVASPSRLSLSPPNRKICFLLPLFFPLSLSGKRKKLNFPKPVKPSFKADEEERKEKKRGWNEGVTELAATLFLHHPGFSPQKNNVETEKYFPLFLHPRKLLFCFP